VEIFEKILVIDDHPIFIDGALTVIKNILPKYAVVACSNGQEALSQIQKSDRIGWIFLDIKLPDISGLELLHKFLDLKLLANVVIVSSDENPETIHTALALHANGFISKQFNRESFEKCISTIERGEIYLDEHHALLVKNYREGIYIEKKFIHDHISERQLEALVMISKGFSNHEIALQMNVTESTVKTHISLLMDLFYADNRSHCVAEARRLGIVS